MDCIDYLSPFQTLQLTSVDWMANYLHVPVHCILKSYMCTDRQQLGLWDVMWIKDVLFHLVKYQVLKFKLKFKIMIMVCLSITPVLNSKTYHYPVPWTSPSQHLTSPWTGSQSVLSGLPHPRSICLSPLSICLSQPPAPWSCSELHPAPSTEKMTDLKAICNHRVNKGR